MALERRQQPPSPGWLQCYPCPSGVRPWLMPFHIGVNGFDDVVQHFTGESGVSAHEQRLLHDAVGPAQIPHHAKGAGPVFPELHQNGLPDEVAAEQHSVADLLLVQMSRELEFAEGRRGFDAHHEPKPGADRAVT